MTDRDRHELDAEVTRRQVMQGALAGGAVLGAGGLLAACGGSSSGGTTAAGGSQPTTGSIKPGGSLKVGATGGGSKGHHRRASADCRPGHHASLEPV